MVLPFITAISRDVFEAVPPVLKEATYGLGCTTWEVFKHVILPYARVGVIGGVMLGLGRALGETMAVTFVIGNAHTVSASILRAGHDHLGLDRQRIHRGGRRPLHLVADRARPDPVRHHLHRAGDRPLHAAAPAAEGALTWPTCNNALYARAPARNDRGARPGARRDRLRPGLAGPDPGRAGLRGHRRPVARGLHREHAAAGLGRRPAQRHRRQHHDDDPGDRSSARRSASWPAPTWPSTAGTTSSPASCASSTTSC